MREHVVAASKAMRNGDWKKSRDLIINDKMNAKVRGNVCQSDTYVISLIHPISRVCAHGASRDHVDWNAATAWCTKAWNLAKVGREGR